VDPDAEKTRRFLTLVEAALASSTLEELADRVLPDVARTMRTNAAVLYLAECRLRPSSLWQHGFPAAAESELERVCAAQFDRCAHPDPQPSLMSVASPGNGDSHLVLLPLRAQRRCLGLLGWATAADAIDQCSDIEEQLRRILGTVVSRLVERVEVEGQLKHLNTYLTVSSALTQSFDLHEVLEIALSSCMEAVAATEASILLLDEEKKNFRFYQVEGPAKRVLVGTQFPADKGLAGSVLRSRQSEVINDVPGDARFYGKVDADSGFRTRNMIAIPLVAGDEEVGVLEAINKADDGSFTEEERLLLDCVAEEIAFAIRNATVFEYVVNTYCRQRQGHASCKGCKRPLGSWTPCIKHWDGTT
jgi:transcriptional regulator with GAF, ATPase, and Fis domain